MRAAGLRNRASPADGVPFARQFQRLALHQGNRGLEGTETVVAVCGPVGGVCGKPTSQWPCPRISSGESGTPCLSFSVWAGWSTGAGAKPCFCAASVPQSARQQEQCTRDGGPLISGAHAGGRCARSPGCQGPKALPESWTDRSIPPAAAKARTGVRPCLAPAQAG